MLGFKEQLGSLQRPQPGAHVRYRSDFTVAFAVALKTKHVDFELQRYDSFLLFLYNRS